VKKDKSFKTLEQVEKQRPLKNFTSPGVNVIKLFLSVNCEFS
jgi:hypothetical protein